MAEEKAIKLDDILLDDDFESLNLSLKEPNIFTLLSIDRRELKHSDFLAWLLNPNENHGLDNIFLQRFIKCIFSDESFENPVRKLLDVTSLDFENVEVRREWRNIDVLVIMKDDVFCIENKVNITDHNNQLERYKSTIEKEFENVQYKHYIYLSPFGDEPTNANEDIKKYWHNFSYEKICEILESIIEIYGKNIPEKNLLYIKDYLTCIRRNIIMSDTINTDARNLYIKYKDAIDFIYANRPDHAAEISEYLEKFIKGKKFVIATRGHGLVRFTTKKLYDEISKHELGKSWGKELFLFELQFNDLEHIFLKATISACKLKNSNISKKLLSIVNKNEAVKSKLKDDVGDKTYYIFYESGKYTFNVENLLKKSETEINQKIEKIWGSFSGQIEIITETFENELKEGDKSIIRQEVNHCLQQMKNKV